MTTVGFECVHCHHRLSVSAEWAGKAVRCPKCQVVVVAPLAGPGSPDPLHGTPIPVLPDLSGATRRASEAESIFSSADDGDEDSLFSSPSSRKPVIPPSDPTQPTVRVPGVPDRVLPPVPPDATVPPASRTAVDLFAGKPTLPVVPAEVTNPFRRMVDEVLTEARQQDDTVQEGAETEELPVAAPAWMTWALVALSVYAVLATAVAAWGWLRPPVEKPAVTSKK